MQSQAVGHGFKLGQLPGAWAFQVSALVAGAQKYTVPESCRSCKISLEIA